ncbi:hypothetical protein D9Q98_010279 [Chlorella vulgaris]|uniref:non-specific serine/threonine protein kinase n=1 Tax=Chlorella vulgaris TaxID=3077 RepID=A0A9D4TJV4_CHLVU|nr:hypothetical protein D9Q98_010279 [Chlorella vulgaris]
MRGRRSSGRQRAPLAAAALRVVLRLALLAATAAAAAATNHTEEAGVMLGLRSLLFGSLPLWVGYRPGWSTASRSPHCSWSGVGCDAQGRVTSLCWGGHEQVAPGSTKEEAWWSRQQAAPLALPPDLARLRCLRELRLAQPLAPLKDGVPAAWVAAGAFPRLQRLQLWVPDLGGPLPDISPQALPALQQLDLRTQTAACLPASWGQRGVLPALQSLALQAAAWEGQLPGSWSGGFRRLQGLFLWTAASWDGSAVTSGSSSSSSSSGGRAAGSLAGIGNGSSSGGGGGAQENEVPSAAASVVAAAPDLSSWPLPLDRLRVGWLLGQPAAPAQAAGGHGPGAGRAGEARRLPSQWAAGFPELRHLAMNGLGLTGSLPGSWLSSTAFPQLLTLDLSGNLLTGHLPPLIFEAHPSLRHLALDSNKLTGRLPPAWAESRVQVLALGGNNLTGPAFPPAWTQPGTLPSLSLLRLSGNAGLSGSLPPRLPWPALKSLLLEGTGLQGSIPQEWCEVPFRLTLRNLWVSGTAVDPVPPVCVDRDVARTYAQLQLDSGGGDAAIAAEPDPRSSGSGSSSEGSGSGTGTVGISDGGSGGDSGGESGSGGASLLPGDLPAGSDRRHSPDHQPAADGGGGNSGGGTGGGGTRISLALVALTAVGAIAALLVAAAVAVLVWRHQRKRRRRRAGGGDGGELGGTGGDRQQLLVSISTSGEPISGAGGGTVSTAANPDLMPLIGGAPPRAGSGRQRQRPGCMLAAAAAAGASSLRSQLRRDKSERTAQLLAATLVQAGREGREIEMHSMTGLPADIADQVEAAAAAAATALPSPTGSGDSDSGDGSPPNSIGGTAPHGHGTASDSAPLLPTGSSLSSSSLASCSVAIAEMTGRAVQQQRRRQLPGSQLQAQRCSSSRQGSAAHSSASVAYSGGLSGGGLPGDSGNSDGWLPAAPPAGPPGEPAGPPPFWRYVYQCSISGSTSTWQDAPSAASSPPDSGFLGGNGVSSGTTVLPPSPSPSGPAAGTAGTAGNVHNKQQQHDGGSGSGGSSSGGGGELQRWAHNSQSMQLSPKSLKFAKDASGQLVVLGEGGFAVVYRALLGQQPVAVKVFELLPELDSSAVWREVALLRQCRHPRIVPVYGVAMKGPVLMMAMQLMEGGSLLTALQDPLRRRALAWARGGRQVAIDVAEGVDYLHTQRQIMHSDLKASNVLLSSDGRASLADLGVSQVLLNSARSAAGLSLLYAAPEQVMGLRCTLAADVYSFGVLLVQLTTQHMGSKRGEWRLPHVPQECSQAVLDLVELCISPTPHRRPTAAQVLQHLLADAAAAALCDTSTQQRTPAGSAN